jgi:hypothetical protein
MLLVCSWLPSRGTKLVSNVVKIDHMDQQLKWTRERTHALTYTKTQNGDIKPLFFYGRKVGYKLKGKISRCRGLKNSNR